MYMTSFNSFRFLCCSMPSFGVSITSLKNSLSFNMSPASAIIFIKCRNHHHMKNNIRYKGNTNNTCVIIFFKIEGQKLAAMVLCLGEPPKRFFVVADLHFIFVSSFHFWSSFCRCSSFVDVLHSHLLFDIIPHPSVDYRRVFTPISYFQPSPSPSDSRHFHSQPFRYLLTARATVLSGHFLPTGAFYLTLLHRHFTSVYQGLPGSWEFFLEVCRASYWSSKHRPGPSVCLIHNNPQSSYSERFSFKFYHILS